MALPRIPLNLAGRELWLMLARDQVGRQLLAEVDAIMLDAFKEVVRALVVNGDRLSPRQSQRMAGLFRSISDVLADRYGTVNNTLTVALSQFSAIEAEIAKQEIALRVAGIGDAQARFGRIDPARLVTIADVLHEGQSLPEWWRQQAAKMSHAARRQIQIGLTLGEGIPDIVKRIVPPNGSVEASVYRQAQREAATVVRTSVTAVSAETQFRTYAAMDPSITDRYEWVAVRDARTSIICIALDGRQWRYDDPKGPRPPAHWNCRSTIRPVINRRGLGLKGPGEPGPGGWKDYEAWLRSQPDTVQRKILGASRFELWRSGKLSLRHMVDSDNRRLKVQDLQNLAIAEEGFTAPQLVTGAAAVSAAPSATLQRQQLAREFADAARLVHGEVPFQATPVSWEHMFGMRGYYDSSTRRIALAERQLASTNRKTLVHEFGHSIDHALGQSFVGPRPPAIKLFEREYKRVTFGSAQASSPEWQEWWKHVRESEHHREISARGTSHSQYLLEEWEVFARAYERWFEGRLPTGHPLKAILQARRDEYLDEGSTWTDADFRAIRAAMTQLFKETGWLRG